MFLQKYCRNLREYWSIINVEPAILFSSISMGLFGTVLPLFLYWARCVELYQEAEVGFNVFFN